MATRTAILNVGIVLNQCLEEIAKKEAPTKNSPADIVRRRKPFHTESRQMFNTRTTSIRDPITGQWAIRNTVDLPAPPREFTRIIQPNGQIAIVSSLTPAEAVAETKAAYRAYGNWFSRLIVNCLCLMICGISMLLFPPLGLLFMLL
jgi:hypothetical protein